MASHRFIHFFMQYVSQCLNKQVDNFSVSFLALPTTSYVQIKFASWDIGSLDQIDDFWGQKSSHFDDFWGQK